VVRTQCLTAEGVILGFNEEFLPVICVAPQAPVLRSALLASTCARAVANGIPIPDFCEVILFEQLSPTRTRSTIETEQPV
jgi:hypothetical protein